MKSFVKKSLLVLVVCVVLNHFTEINFTGMIAKKIDELTNCTYATEFVEGVQKRVDYLIDNIKVRMLKKEDDKLSFEVTVGIPDVNQEIDTAETTETIDESKELGYFPESNDLSVAEVPIEDDSASSGSEDDLDGQVSKYIHLVITAGQAVLDEINE